MFPTVKASPQIIGPDIGIPSIVIDQKEMSEGTFSRWTNHLEIRRSKLTFPVYLLSRGIISNGFYLVTKHPENPESHPYSVIGSLDLSKPTFDGRPIHQVRMVYLDPEFERLGIVCEVYSFFALHYGALCSDTQQTYSGPEGLDRSDPSSRPGEALPLSLGLRSKRLVSTQPPTRRLPSGLWKNLRFQPLYSGVGKAFSITVNVT